jgi:hypothetical protein
MDTMNAQRTDHSRATPMINNQTYPHVAARIEDLYATAADLRAGRTSRPHRPGLVSRTRVTIGRRLISLGGAVARQRVGQRA